MKLKEGTLVHPTDKDDERAEKNVAGPLKLPSAAAAMERLNNAPSSTNRRYVDHRERETPRRNDGVLSCFILLHYGVYLHNSSMISRCNDEDFSTFWWLYHTLTRRYHNLPAVPLQ